VRRALASSLLLAAAVYPAVARAQTAPDSACSYTRCALRVEHRFLSTRLVRGTSGESVGRLGWFGSGVGVLLAGGDSAAHYARLYQTKSRTAEVLSILAATMAFAGTLQGDDGAPLLIGGITLELAALPFWLGSRRSLDRAVWWYNRDLPRP